MLALSWIALAAVSVLAWPSVHSQPAKLRLQSDTRAHPPEPVHSRPPEPDLTRSPLRPDFARAQLKSAQAPNEPHSSPVGARANAATFECVDEQLYRSLLLELELAGQVDVQPPVATRPVAISSLEDLMSDRPAKTGAAHSTARFWARVRAKLATIDANRLLEVSASQLRVNINSSLKRKLLLDSLGQLKLLLSRGESDLCELHARMLNSGHALDLGAAGVAVCNCISSKVARLSMQTLTGALNATTSETAFDAIADSGERGAQIATETSEFCSQRFSRLLSSALARARARARARTRTRTPKASRTKRSILDDNMFSNPFDAASNYADMDDLAGELRESSLQPEPIVRLARSAERPAASASDDEPSATGDDQQDLWTARFSASASKCAREGVRNALVVLRDQTEVMYPRSILKMGSKYASKFRSSLLAQFDRSWSKLSRHAHQVSELTRLHSNRNPMHNNIEDPYVRGSSLGFYFGYYAATKALERWPDPAQINTFAHDGHFDFRKPNESCEHEWRIVQESAKRLAFLGSNWEAFKLSVDIAFVNGLLGHRSRDIRQRVAQVAAREAAKLGLKIGRDEAASFEPQALAFFDSHKPRWSQTNQTRGQSKRAEPRQSRCPILGSELALQVHRRLERIAGECGQKSGAVMGAVVGLLATPEGSRAPMTLDLYEPRNDHHYKKFKLGTMRGYQLGALWAQASPPEWLLAKAGFKSVDGLFEGAQPLEADARTSASLLEFMVKKNGDSAKWSLWDAEIGARLRRLGIITSKLVEPIELQDLHNDWQANGLELAELARLKIPNE